jgi:hypothetical protein
MLTLLTIFIFAVQVFMLLDCRLVFSQVAGIAGAYDELSLSLLRGSAEVGESIRFEGMERQGKVFMYFGPLPAIVRIPFHTLFPESYGKLGLLSFVLAAALFLTFYFRLTLFCILRSWELIPGDRIPYMRVVLAALILIGFPLGFEFFLVHSKTIYKEAILWGLAANMASLFYAFVMLKKDQFLIFPLFMLGLTSGCALLARIPFGITSGLFCGVVLIRLLFLLKKQSPENFKSSSSSCLLKITALCLPALICLGIQFWYNVARFDSPTSFFDYESYRLGNRMPKAYEGGIEYGTFAPVRIPRTFAYYFSFSHIESDSKFPYFKPGSVSWDKRFTNLAGKVVPLSLCGAFLLFGAACGLWNAIHRKEMYYVLVLALLCLPQFFLILSFMSIYQRYEYGLLPFFFCLLFGWLAHLRESNFAKSSFIVIGFALSVAISVAATMSTMVDWECKYCHQRHKTGCVLIRR